MTRSEDATGTRSSADTVAWRGFATTLAGAAAVLLLALYGFVLALDPYGVRASASRAPTAIMDVNQRYMYPQLARSARFDSAVFGTSTVRLLDPERLGELLGGRFANLGLNAGTPWEQLQLARLFLRHVPAPRTLLFGLDRSWCESAADDEASRLTFRPFPPWLYDEDRLNDLPGLLNLKSLEIAGRVALHGLELMPARIRPDGYEVFTPPEGRYDLAQARLHLRRDVQAAGRDGPSVAAGTARPFPALDWLAAFGAEVPSTTRLLLVLPPIHVAAQAEPGTAEEASDAACKAGIVEIARRRGVVVVDFRLPTALTGEDSNYWDKLHYRLPVAARVVESLAQAARTGEVPPDGSARLLSR